MGYDLAIIVGGPAEVAAGVYAARKWLKTVFITKDWNGQSAVSEGIENWIGETKIPGIELAKKLENHLKAMATNSVAIKEGELAAKVTKTANGFSITTNKGTYEARALLITSGSSRRKLDVPGAEQYDNKGLTYCASCDGPLYADQDVAVIGGGNAAFETAAQLMAYCRSITLLNRSDNFKADPGTVAAVSKNPRVKIVTGAVPKEVKGGKFVSSFVYTDAATKKDIELPVTGIFVEIGSIPNTNFLTGVVELDQYARVITDPKNQRASADGVWAAGDVTDGLYHQNNIAAGDGVKALEDIYLYLHAN